jgi:hypothetical protein
MLPNFMILGAAKSGTSAMNYYLSQHPDICMAAPKEPPFFSAEYENGLDYYEKQYFSHWSHQRLVGEAAHRNLYLPYVPQRIADTLPDARFVVQLRNPTERAYSHYWYDYTHDIRNWSFEECLERDLDRLHGGPSFDDPAEYLNALDRNGHTPKFPTFLDTGYYAEQVQRYADIFGLERIKIVFFEDLTRATQDTVDDVVRFLGLDPIPPKDLSPQNQPVPTLVNRIYRAVGALPGIEFFPVSWRNAVKREVRGRFSRPKPPMKPETREWLIEHYRSRNDALAAITGRDLSHWDSTCDN